MIQEYGPTSQVLVTATTGPSAAVLVAWCARRCLHLAQQHHQRGARCAFVQRISLCVSGAPRCRNRGAGGAVWRPRGRRIPRRSPDAIPRGGRGEGRRITSTSRTSLAESTWGEVGIECRRVQRFPVSPPTSSIIGKGFDNNEVGDVSRRPGRPGRGIPGGISGRSHEDAPTPIGARSETRHPRF